MSTLKKEAVYKCIYIVYPLENNINFAIFHLKAFTPELRAADDDNDGSANDGAKN